MVCKFVENVNLIFKVKYYCPTEQGQPACKSQQHFRMLQPLQTLQFQIKVASTPVMRAVVAKSVKVLNTPKTKMANASNSLFSLIAPQLCQGSARNVTMSTEF